jgi:hypothetical protein
LAGNSEGSEPDAESLVNSVSNLAAGVAQKGNEAIFYVDESRK